MFFFKNMRIIKILLISGIILTITPIHATKGRCILFSIYDQKSKNWKHQNDCDSFMQTKKFSSGSLFKIFILSAAYYYHLIPKTHSVDIQTKMLKSDNSYFIYLMKKMGKKQFIQFLNTQMKGYFQSEIHPKHFSSWFSFVHGGNLKFTPEHIHSWFIRFVFDKRDFVQNALHSLIQKEKSINFFGKSGTWDGSAWFCGVYQNQNTIQVISVLHVYKKPFWKKAKQRSYEIFLRYLKSQSP